MASRCTVSQGSLSQTGPAVTGTGTARSTSVYPSPPMASLSAAIWGTGWAVALPCPGQGWPSIWQSGAPILWSSPQDQWSWQP